MGPSSKALNISGNLYVYKYLSLEENGDVCKEKPKFTIRVFAKNVQSRMYFLFILVAKIEISAFELFI